MVSRHVSLFHKLCLSEHRILPIGPCGLHPRFGRVRGRRGLRGSIGFQGIGPMPLKIAKR